MGIELADDADGTITAVAWAALAEAGVGPSSDGGPARSAWWRAGVVEALERAPTGPTPARYEAARSPRSTRGATRA